MNRGNPPDNRSFMQRVSDGRQAAADEMKKMTAQPSVGKRGADVRSDLALGAGKVASAGVNAMRDQQPNPATMRPTVDPEQTKRLMNQVAREMQPAQPAKKPGFFGRFF